MRLQLILPQVNATEYGKVLVCPRRIARAGTLCTTKR